MNRVFVDTGSFYASLNRRDASHRNAACLFRRAQREHWFLCTTNFVLAESHALILAPMGRNRAWNFLQAIITESTNVFQQGLRDRGTVDVEEGPLGARATVMEHAGHQALAGAGCALEQHGGDGELAQGIKGRQVLELGAQGREGGARPDEAVGRMARRRWGRMVHRRLLWRLAVDNTRMAPGVAPGAILVAPLCARIGPGGKQNRVQGQGLPRLVRHGMAFA